MDPAPLEETLAATPEPTKVETAPAVRTEEDVLSTVNPRPAECESSCERLVTWTARVGKLNWPARSDSDSEKAEAAGWGADEGKKELEAEVLAEGDAKEEQAATGTATPVREAPIEEEDNTQTYEQYLAAQAEKKLNIAALPEARKANDGVEDSQWANATAISKKGETEEEWLMGAPVRTRTLSCAS